MYIIGVDLGQTADYTAIAAVEVRLPEVHLRHLERLPLGTPYPAVVTHVRTLLATPPLNTNTVLVLDRTGVGAAVADLFVAGGRTPIGITLTGGDKVTREKWHYWVPKRDLVGVLIAMFQTGRLKIAAGLAEAETLTTELMHFRMKVDLRTAHDSYEAWREGVHDDLVLATGLACWFVTQLRPPPEAIAGGSRTEFLRGYRSDIEGLRPRHHL
jgi:hypothetical protein